jgi:hypothetical protein
VHNGNKVEMEFGEIGSIHEFQEPILQNGHESVTVIGLDFGLFDLFFELFERFVVGGLALKEELEDFLDLLRLKLVVDGVQILGLVFPERDLHQWVGVTVFESLLGLEFQDIFDLFRPHNNATLENVGLVLLGDVVPLGELVRRGRELGLALDLPHGDEGLGEIVVELLDEVLGDELGPLPGVLLIVQQRHEDLLEDPVHVVQGVFGDFHADQAVGHDIFSNLILHIIFIQTNLINQFQNTDGLARLDPI